MMSSPKGSTTTSNEPTALTVPFVDSPFLEDALPKSGLSAADQALVREYAEKGYVTIDLGMPDFDAVAASILKDLAPLYPKDDRRVAEAWYFHEGVKKVACAPKLIDVLRKLYRREPIPFQTLNFDAGTQQPAHSDTIHFHCVPHHYMCGVWVAFEDIQPGTGELFVVPKSHRLKTFDMLDLGLTPNPSAYRDYEKSMGKILEAEGLTRVPVYPKKGQALIWHANLLHGGMPMEKKGSTRHSQASHYYFDDCMYYFPMGSDPYRGKMILREVIDIRDGKFIGHKYRGQDVDLAEYKDVLTYPRPLPDWVEKPKRSDASPQKEPERSRQPSLLHSVKKTVRGLIKPDGQ
jgi:hypothetical protein